MAGASLCDTINGGVAVWQPRRCCAPITPPEDQGAVATDPCYVARYVEPHFQENTYLLYRRAASECWVVDPGLPPQAEQVAQVIRQNRLGLATIMLTHGHADHIAGVAHLKQLWPDAQVRIARADQAMLNDPRQNLSAGFGIPIVLGLEPDCDLQPGEEIPLDGLIWRVLDTSGHSPGGRSLYCPAQDLVITGDALFAGSIGRTDLPGSHHAQLLANIRRQLLTLPESTRVLPGHGPATSIGQERRHNPFLSGLP
jgi:hydroxyacylglutathione hydrolase